MDKIIFAIVGFFADIKERFAPDCSEVVASVVKLEARIEAAIRKDTGKLMALRAAADAIEAQRSATDAAQNAAYRLLNKISGLTA